MSTATASKITVDREAFAKVLSIVGKSASTRGTRPILRNAKISVADGRVELFATDLERYVSSSLDCEQSDPWQVLVPADVAMRFCQAANGDVLSISTDGSHVLLECERARIKLGYENPSEFPSNGKAVGEIRKFRASQLSEAFRSVQYAATSVAGSIAFNSVLVEFSYESCVFVALDGRTMSIAEFPLASTSVGFALIPLSSVRPLLAILASEDEAELSIDANLASVQAGNTLFSTRLMDGTFPKWQRIIPSLQRHKAEFSFVAGPLLNAVKLARISCDTESTRLDLRCYDQTLFLQAETADRGVASSEVPVDCDKVFSIGLSGPLLTDFLASVDPSQLVTAHVGEDYMLFSSGVSIKCLIMSMTKL